MSYTKSFIKGILIGISFLVPGLSGGTMMIILNVFDDAIHALNQLLQFKPYRLAYYCVMAFGILTGITFFAGLMSIILSLYSGYAMTFFLGVILSGVLEIGKLLKGIKIGFRHVIAFVVSFLLVMLLTYTEGRLVNVMEASGMFRFVSLVLIGIPTSVALILPGLSTSYLFLVFGIYEKTLTSITTFDLEFLFPLLLGILLGVVFFTRFIEYAIANHKETVYVSILGLILGSCMSMFAEISFGSIPELLLSLVFGIAGFLCITFITKVFDKN
ncbi:DUF368 domain-containing protein [Erysipelothrix sp. D19-032]